MALMNEQQRALDEFRAALRDAIPTWLVSFVDRHFVLVTAVVIAWVAIALSLAGLHTFDVID